ncbi:hypothetical protein ACVIEO_000003 [Rhizobium leguminosarum]
MNETINIFRLRQPDEIEDPLTNVLRSGARKLLAQAIEMEAEAFLGAISSLPMVVIGLSGMVTPRNGASRRGSGRCRSAG